MSAEEAWAAAPFALPEAPPPLPPCPFTPTFPAMLRHIAAAYQDLEAIVRGAQRLTYRQLERRSAVLAKGLIACGLGKGSRVAVLMPSGPDFVVALAAASRIGALVTPLSTLYQAPELRWVLNHADIGVLLTADRYMSHDYLAKLETAFPTLAGQSADALYLPEAPALRRIFTWGDANRRWARDGVTALSAAGVAVPGIDEAFLAAVEANVTPADPFCTIYTSGSTADPKGVVHNHGPIIRHTFGISHVYYPFAPGERLVGARAWFWVAGLSSGLIGSLQAGLCTILPEGDSGEEGAELALRENATLFGFSHDYFARVTAALQARGEDAEVISMMFGLGALARRGPDGAMRYVRDWLEARAPARFLPPPARRLPNFLGMTETLGGHSVEGWPTVMPADMAGVTGRAVFGLERRIVDPETGRTLPAGQTGELAVRGPALMAGFHKKERSEVFEPDGFYRTGDECSIDAQDFLTIHGRLADVVKISGANVSPLEVERAILALDGVQSAVAMGLDRRGRKTLLAAAVVRAPDSRIGEADIVAALKSQLSSFKVPKRIVFMAREEIPMTATGKVRKLDLAPLLIARLEAEEDVGAP
ncbi:MAG: class I adenylate-forming enzyme family protein [Phenylobacterium sp.]